MTIPHIITSGELATKFVEEGGPCTVSLLDFEEPSGASDLLTLLVVGRTIKDFSAPAERSAAPRNAALADLRALHSGSNELVERITTTIAQPGRRPAAPQRCVINKSRPVASSSSTLPSGHPAGALEPIMDGGIDALGDGLGDVDDLSESDVAEMIEACVPGAGDEDATAPEAPGASASVSEGQPSPEVLVGPSPLGYYRNTGLGRDVMRVSGPFSGGSMAVRCFQHPKCTLAIPGWRLPSPDKLKEWFWSVRPATSDDSVAVQQALAKEHIAKLRALKDAAGQ